MSSYEAIAQVIAELVQILREARRGQRITQVDLAARLGVTEITIVEWETRRHIPATSNLFRWAIELGYVVEIQESSIGEVVEKFARKSTARSMDEQIRQMSRVLKLARMKIGLTQEELGDKLGVSSWTVRMWERALRTPRLVHLVAWCAILNYQISLTSAAAGLGKAPVRAATASAARIG